MKCVIMNLKKKENIVIIVLLVVMILAIIGVSYAAFSFSQAGNTPNKITTGSITMTYEESENTISIGNALPTTDATGTTRLKDGEYFDFTVSSEITGEVNINYEISAKEIGDDTIDGSNIKLYLTELVDGEEQELMTPEVYNEETSENTYTGRPANEMSLYTSSMNASEEHNYRLRMYVREEYNPQGDGGGLTFTVQVNVYGKAGDKPLTGAEMLIEKANPEDLDYNSATSEQQKEAWVHTHPETEQTEALTDYRYIGSDPNNYVEFNDELWRIIGVFTVDDGTGNIEKRLKIIRNESIGEYSWDTKDTSTGAEDNYGKNNWTDARLNYLLNPGHEGESVGGSLYWNSVSGTCYNGQNNGTTNCDFTSSGLNSHARDMIGDTVWYLGGSSTYDDVTAPMFYERERGTNVYSGRDTSWVGKIGVMYISDYGYATSGGSIIDRNSCLNKELYNWDSSSFSDCKNNDWLYESSYIQWTLSPYASSSRIVFYVDRSGCVSNSSAYYSRGVRPVAFLKSNIKIVDGDGSSSNPYKLQG